MMRVKKGDTVQVLTGKDRNKTGKVIAVLPTENKIMVSGVAIIARHTKARRSGDVAGIKKYESYINASNVMPVCSSCNKPCRITIAFSENGQKNRACGNCSEKL